MSPQFKVWFIKAFLGTDFSTDAELISSSMEVKLVLPFFFSLFFFGEGGGGHVAHAREFPSIFSALHEGDNDKLS